MDAKTKRALELLAAQGGGFRSAEDQKEWDDLLGTGDEMTEKASTDAKK